MEGSRRAVLDDAEGIAALSLLARGELANQRGGDLFLGRELPSAHTPADVIFRLNSADHAVWVGTLEGHLVGYGLGRVERLDVVGLHGVVDEIYVEPEARSVGVGQAVMEGLVTWFVSTGCLGVDAQALPGSRQVKTFLESSGFKARLIVLHRPLSS